MNSLPYNFVLNNPRKAYFSKIESAVSIQIHNINCKQYIPNLTGFLKTIGVQNWLFNIFLTALI